MDRSIGGCFCIAVYRSIFIPIESRSHLHPETLHFYNPRAQLSVCSDVRLDAPTGASYKAELRNWGHFIRGSERFQMISIHYFRSFMLR